MDKLFLRQRVECTCIIVLGFNMLLHQKQMCHLWKIFGGCFYNTVYRPSGANILMPLNNPGV